ncbi:MAG: ARPP-1 family domain-containing protein [Planctomycetota bacterium]
MLATAPFRLDILTSDLNQDSLRLIEPTPGLTFAFLRGSGNAATPPAHLFGLGATGHEADESDSVGDGNGDDGNAAPHLEVEETSLSGSVPTLRAHNRSKTDILIIAGQVLRGGKQNRGINTDILIEAGKSAEIPVTCVEQGRWSGSPRSRFHHAGVEPIFVRSAKMRDVHMSRRERASHAANQGRVWSSIADMQSAFGVASPSSDMLQSLEAVKSRRLAVPRNTEDEHVSMMRLELVRLTEEVARIGRALARGMHSTAPTRAEHLSQRLSFLMEEIAFAREQLIAAEQAAAARPPQGAAEPADAPIDFAEADKAACDASGMLVFFKGEFLAGDVFADPQWFAKLYGDLRDSALASWLHLSRRGVRADPAAGDAGGGAHGQVESAARSIVRDLAAGEWRERPVVAQGRGWLLEHPSIEGSVLAGSGDQALHLLVGTRNEPRVLSEAMRSSAAGRAMREDRPVR